MEKGLLSLADPEEDCGGGILRLQDNNASLLPSSPYTTSLQGNQRENLEPLGTETVCQAPYPASTAHLSSTVPAPHGVLQSSHKEGN